MESTTKSQHKFHISLLHPSHWGTWLLIVSTLIFVPLPWRVRKILGTGLGMVIIRLSKKRTLVARKNLELCRPASKALQQHSTDYWLNKHFQALGVGLLESLRVCFLPKSMLLSRFAPDRCIGLEAFLEAKKIHGGVLLLSTHCTFLELGLAITSVIPFVSGAREHSNPVLNWFVHSSKQRFTEYNLNIRNPFALSQALRDKHTVIRFADQYGGGSSSVKAPLFSIETDTIAHYKVMATRAKAQVFSLQFRLHEEDGKMSVHLEPFDEYLQAKDLIEAAAKMNERIEKAVEFSPEHWLWLHRRFKDVEAQDSPYTR